jgi:nucleotide-binding universal stress UspA family protein
VGVSTPQGILVGYDGASDGDVALEWAVDTATKTQDSVRVVIVEDVSLNDGSGLWTEEYWDGVEQRARATLGSLGIAEPDVERLRGRPVDALLDLAPKAGMLVVGSRGHGRVGEMLLGSVSQHLAGHAACPVVVVRPAARPGADRVVVGMDGSGPAARALELACSRAEKTGEKVAAVTGVRVSRDLPVDERGNLPDKTSAHLLERERELKAWTAPAKSAHPTVDVTEEVVALPAGRALVDSSADASLVIVGTRGRNAFTGMVLGSTSHEVLHRARCSVVVVR